MKKKRFGPLLGAAAFCVLALVLFFVWQTTRPAAQAGEKHITVEVIHSDETKVEFTYDTDEEYLGAVLLSEGLISGTDGPYGLYVDTVDGETASYETDSSWWRLSCNGEDTTTGADTTPVADGDVFTWTYTVG